MNVQHNNWILFPCRISKQCSFFVFFFSCLCAPFWCRRSLMQTMFQWPKAKEEEKFSNLSTAIYMYAWHICKYTENLKTHDKSLKKNFLSHWIFQFTNNAETMNFPFVNQIQKKKVEEKHGMPLIRWTNKIDVGSKQLPKKQIHIKISLEIHFYFNKSMNILLRRFVQCLPNK